MLTIDACPVALPACRISCLLDLIYLPILFSIIFLPAMFHDVSPSLGHFFFFDDFFFLMMMGR